MPEAQEVVNPLQERPPTFRAAMMNMNPKIALAFFLVFMAAVLLVFMAVMFKYLDAGSAALIASLVTLFVKMADNAVGYQYNSSSGSDKKDDIQANVAATLANKVQPSPSPQPLGLTTDQLGEAQLVNGELTYFKALPSEDAKKAFLGMSSAERQAEIAKVGT